jgi:hypothetical protein
MVAFIRIGQTDWTGNSGNTTFWHALIPELSFPATQRDKRRLREVQVHLATLANQSVVQHPGS